MPNRHGEEISLFHEIFPYACKLNPRGENDTRKDVPLICNWLCTAKSTTLARAIGPTIHQCNSLFFCRYPAERVLCVLGNYGLQAQGQLLRYQVDPSLESLLRHHCPEAVSCHCVILDWTARAWKPVYYAVPPAESNLIHQELLRTSDYCYDIGPGTVLVYSIEPGRREP